MISKVDTDTEQLTVLQDAAQEAHSSRNAEAQTEDAECCGRHDRPWYADCAWIGFGLGSETKMTAEGGRDCVSRAQTQAGDFKLGRGFQGAVWNPRWAWRSAARLRLPKNCNWKWNYRTTEKNSAFCPPLSAAGVACCISCGRNETSPAWITRGRDMPHPISPPVPIASVSFSSPLALATRRSQPVFVPPLV